MSLVTSHIRALRALARSLDVESAHLILEDPSGHKVGKRVLQAFSEACKGAAEELEREEMELLEHVGRIERTPVDRDT